MVLCAFNLTITMGQIYLYRTTYIKLIELDNNYAPRLTARNIVFQTQSTNIYKAVLV